MRTSILVICVASFFLTGCMSWFGGGDEPVSEVKEEGESSDDSAIEISGAGGMDEMELKLAKVWSKVAELEEEVFRQKERVRVLEKGLMLGLVPEELKSPPPAPAPKPQIKAPPPPKKKEQPKSPLSKEELDRYRDLMAKAHQMYRQGRYGLAIKAFSDVDSEFGDKLEDGVQKYWSARSWSHLKEYSIAHQQLVDFIQKYPASAFLPRARLEMARIEIKQGLRESAIENLKKIIDQFPYEDAAEMAKMELQRINSTL